jgi:acyl-coenzyme A synthetase/AMP-(fatty) acid ligase
MRVRAGMLAVDAAARHADRIVLGGERDGITFAELDRTANRVATGLRALGVQAGDRVAVLSYNRPELVAVWLGCERAAFVRVVLHSHFPMTLQAPLIRDVEASVVVFDARFAHAISGYRGKLGGVRWFVAIGEGVPEWALSYDELLAKGVAQLNPVDVDEDAPLCVQPTTGTTGAPKPWVVTHRAWAALVAHNINHLDTLASSPVSEDDVNLHVHALQWASGAQTLLPYLIRGARSVLLDDAGFDPMAIAQTIASQRVTGVLLPGPMLVAILDAIEALPSFTHRLRRVVTLFATPELLQRLTKTLGPVWCHCYGATEQGAPATRVTAAEAADAPVRLNSVGRPASPFLDLRVVDERGDGLDADRVGEIVVRSPMSSSGYWGNAELSAEAVLPGGWFRSRDLGYLDAAGFLFYVDRACDAIELEQGTVFPHEVEAAVMRHPAVANCGAVGLGDASERRVVAAVVLKDGHQSSEELAAEIEAAAAPGLATFAHPRVLLVEELPTVLGGAKVQRHLLREQLSATTLQA